MPVKRQDHERQRVGQVVDAWPHGEEAEVQVEGPALGGRHTLLVRISPWMSCTGRSFALTH
jgi:hypothetical protein